MCRGRKQARGAIYSRPEAVAENGVLRRGDTTALRWCGRFQRLNIVVGALGFLFGANRVGIWGFRGSSTEWGGAGPSAAGSALCACRTTATVLHACAGKEVATRSHQDAWAAPNGVVPPFCFLSAATALRPPQDTPAQAGQGATDARKAPSMREALDKQACP